MRKLLLVLVLVLLSACRDTSGFDPAATWRAQLDLTRTAQAPPTETAAATDLPSITATASASASPTASQTPAMTETATTQPTIIATETATREATVTPSPTVSETAWPTPTQIVQGTITPSPTEEGACRVSYPRWCNVYRIYKVINLVWLCVSAAPCGGDPDYQIRLRPVDEVAQVRCLYEIAATNIWASEFNCDAAFDRSWSAVVYNGRRYLELIEIRD